MNKLMMGVVMGLLFLAVATHESYADGCKCSGSQGRGDAKNGTSMDHKMNHHGPDFMNGPRERDHFLWKKLMALGLSEKQMDTLKAIRSRVTKDSIKKTADLQLARVEFRELLHKEPVDMSGIEASLKKAESVRTDLKLSHIKAMEEMKAVLTPEQRKKLKEDIKAGFMKHERWGRGDMSMPDPITNEAQNWGEDR